MSVLELIKFDRKIRHDKKYEEDIFKLQDLDKKNKWDYSLPTLCKHMNAFNKSKIINLNTESFKETFYKTYPALKDITWDGIFIAGGCIGDIILRSESKSSLNHIDIDIFIYCDSDVEASAIVARLINEIVTYEKINYAKQNSTKNEIILPESVDEENHLDIEYTRTKFTLNMGKFQIIFRRYSSKSEIIHGFDLGSSAVGFDGDDIYFTSLSKFAYETGCNIIDTMRRSKSYEHRLQKYFRREFDIIMPEFDITKLDKYRYDTYRISDMGELPYMCFTYDEVSRNKINLTDFYHKNSEKYIQSDYCDAEDNYCDGNEFLIFYTNLYKLLINKPDEMIYVSYSSQDILNPKLSLLNHKIDYFYDELYKKIMSGDKFPTSMISKYLPCTDTGYIFTNREDKEVVLYYIEKQKMLIKEKLESIVISSDIQWQSVNPGTQLTGSFNPIIEDASQWYGKYFIKQL